MGKRYYCDYCVKTMSCTPSIIRTHNNGLLHQKAKQEHFQKFKDPETILAEEAQKRPCARFPFGKCQFGSICKFSHYSQEDIQSLQNYVLTKQFANTMVDQPSFQDLYNKLQTEKSASRDDGHTVLIDGNGVTHKLPWTYNAAITQHCKNNFDSLPPSIRQTTVDDFNYASFSEWG